MTPFHTEPRFALYVGNSLDVTPPGGVVLDPFMGSGSTGRGAMLEKCRFIGIDLSEDYATISRARIAAVAEDPSLFDAVS